MTNFKKHVDEPYFTLLKTGQKVCEGRLLKGDFTKMKVLDKIEFDNGIGTDKFTCKIVSINRYDTFREYLLSETLERCLPGVTDIEEGILIYYKFFTVEDEKKYGVVGISVEI